MWAHTAAIGSKGLIKRGGGGGGGGGGGSQIWNVH